MKKPFCSHVRRILLYAAAIFAVGITARSSADINPMVVQTMVDLRAIDVSGLTNDTTVLMVDYYLPSQVVYQGGGETHGRGGGFFRWRTGNSSSDDGGRFIAPNSNSNLGRWERML